MIYGNNGDTFRLEAGGDGRLYLNRNGLDMSCPRSVGGWLCCDDCALFQRHHDGEITEAHLCCCSPPVVIRITDKCA